MFVITLVVFVFIFSMLNFFSFYYLGVPLSPVALTGQVVENGVVKLYVEGGPKVITIYYPLNTTYDSGDYTCSTPADSPKCSDFRYILPLNVSADFFVDEWSYSLYDLEHSEDGDSGTLIPNRTISATRWGNRLTVSAHEVDGDWITEEVVFNIEVPNSEPVFGSIDSELYACEGERFDSRFSASDVDEETLTESISPKNPLNSPFDSDSLGKSNLTVSLFRIKTGPLTTTLLGVINGFNNKTYLNREISVVDESLESNSVYVNITVIEVNNPVTLNDIKPYTVNLADSGSGFNYQAIASDAEDGDSSDGNLNFNLSGAPDYYNVVINSSTGVMNYTPIADHNGSVLDLTVCVNDSALSSSHSNFAYCAAKNFANESTSVCRNFTLTVTDVNRAPVIDSYSPSTDNFTVAGTTATVFNVSVSDADGGNLSIDWYVDGALKEESVSATGDDYSYAFGCGVSGEHEVSVIVSDGLVNVTQVWNVSVSIVACPVASSSGGGGGGGGGTLGGYCTESWACGDWDVCQNVERSFVARSLSPEDYYFSKEICAQNQFDERFCGFQLAECVDLRTCNNSEYKVPKPVERRACYFTENPSCSDGITNCHDGACELLVDCGGPCEMCPTCSDGKQNQGEGDVDCGGPCPFRCDAESPFGEISFALIGLAVVLIGAVVFIGIKLFGIWRYGGFVKKKKKR